MKFYPISPIRYFFRYAMLFIFIFMPLLLAFFGTDTVYEEDIEKYRYFCIGMSIWGAVFINAVFWEKFFAYLTITEEKICWNCLFRKTKVIPVSHCVEIGAYVENANNGVPSERIYISAIPDPKERIGKNGVMKKSKHIIQFWYTSQLCNYLIETMPESKTVCLVTYKKQRKDY